MVYKSICQNDEEPLIKISSIYNLVSTMIVSSKILISTFICINYKQILLLYLLDILSWNKTNIAYSMCVATKVRFSFPFCWIYLKYVTSTR